MGLMKKYLILSVLLCGLVLVLPACNGGGLSTPDRRPDADGVIVSVDSSSTPVVVKVVHLEDPKKGIPPTKSDVTLVKVPAGVKVLQMDGESYRKVDAALLKPKTSAVFWLKGLGTDSAGYRTGTAETIVYGGEYTPELPAPLP